MAQAEFREVLGTDKDKLFSVITRYEDYPQFVEGCSSVQVDRQAPGKIRVTYRVNVMSQDVTYTLDHKEDSATGVVEWTLIESNFFKKNTGRWELKASGSGKTDVLYSLELEFKIPVPGFILNRLVKGSLPGMVKSFEKQAKKSS
jgi:ribosome-associated toxin RatA of RatAB toxin-antitoxin module